MQRMSGPGSLRSRRSFFPVRTPQGVSHLRAREAILGKSNREHLLGKVSSRTTVSAIARKSVLLKVPSLEGRPPASRQLQVREIPRYCAPMFTIRSSRPTDHARIIKIWRGAVDATHHFLSIEDRIAIDREVCAFLPQAPLVLAVDQKRLSCWLHADQ